MTIQERRARAMCSVSSQILQVASLQVRAIKTAEECGLLNEDMPALIATKDSKADTKEGIREEKRKQLLEVSSWD